MGQTSVQHRFLSPLRYPGGKGKVANFLKLLFLRNNLLGHEYVEPYAGGASVALSLLFEEYASHIHINDLNKSIYAFWQAVLVSTDALCARIQNTEVTLREWEVQKKVQLAFDPDPVDLAFSTFFLNRTNRSGIIGGGIIGGKDQTGTWKLDARYNKDDLIRRIQKIARFRSRITLSNVDASAYLTQVVPTLGGNTFIYLDPPYYVKGEGLYEHFYEDADHVEIAACVAALDRPWLVSYDAHPRILSLYQGYQRLIYGLSYSAADRYKGAEVMFFCPEVVRPDLSSPSGISHSAVDAEKTRVMFGAV